MDPTPGRQAMFSADSLRIVAESTDVKGRTETPREMEALIDEGLRIAAERLSHQSRTRLAALLEAGPLSVESVSVRVASGENEAEQIGSAVAKELGRFLEQAEDVAERSERAVEAEIRTLLAGVDDNSPIEQANFWSRLQRKVGYASKEILLSPVLTWKRGAFTAPPVPGKPVPGLTKSRNDVVNAVETDLTQIARGFRVEPEVMIGSVEAAGEVDLLHERLAQLTPKYGVGLKVSRGLPLANWAPFPTIKIGKSAGFAHEMIHAFQMTLGGAAALGTASGQKLVASGEASPSLPQILGGIRDLSVKETRHAYQTYVGPAESRSYALYEAGAGLGGKAGSPASSEEYREALLTNIQAFAETFRTANAPNFAPTPGGAAYGAAGQVIPGGLPMFATLIPTIGIISAGAFMATGSVALGPITIGAGTLVSMGAFLNLALPFLIASGRAGYQAKKQAGE